MSVKLWVDDERPAPDDSWQVRTSSLEARRWLASARSFGFVIEEVSLDHDLGGDDTTMSVIAFMAEHGIWPQSITIHTQNPVGRNNLKRALDADAPKEVDIYLYYW